jgi:hypothetical protein
MHAWRLTSLWSLVIAGLLIQMAGPLARTGPTVAQASVPSARPAAVRSGQAGVRGYFAASRPASLPQADALLAPPSAGAYYQSQGLNPLTNLQATTVGGTIVTDTTWTLAGSPYVATSSVTVGPTATLTIEPGVVISHNLGTALTINGRLLALGTPTAGITFTGSAATPGAWGGLRFEGVPGSPLTGSQLDYVTISGGGQFGGFPANLYLFQAEVSLSHAVVSQSKYSGVYGGERGVAHISDTTVSNNGTTDATEDYALWFTDGSVAPNLANLTLTGNSQNAIALGGGTLTTRTWKSLGYPYILKGILTVPYTATLTIEPGVVVKSGGNAQTNINILGRLEARGEPTAPITFTAVVATQGAWSGLLFTGQPGQFATGVLNYTTVEYGGSCASCANLSVSYAQVNISHGQFRFSSKAGLRAGESGAAGLVVEHSHFVGNATYGVENADPTGSVLAVNNWWGDASGPLAPNNCNLGGSGQAVTARVAFLPFITDPNAPADDVAPSQVLWLSLNPLRYYAPADGTTKVWFEVTLRDGAGLPVVGQIVRLNTTLGTVVDGGATDAAGRTFTYLTSNTIGEANVFAELDTLEACQFARSAAANISFTGTPDDPLSPDAQSPYSNAGVEFDPQPVILGVPGVLRVRLHNPNAFAITVDATFSFAQLGLGLIFGPVGQVNGVIIPPLSEGVLELPWVPLVAGHFCINVDYTWAAVTSAAAPAGFGSGSTRSNAGSAPGPMLRPFDKTAIQRASVATTSLGDITFAAAGLDDIAAVGVPGASAPVGFLQGTMVGNILDFIFEGGGGIDCAMKGGASCGGWKGPRMHFPGESFGNLASDPPSPDYNALVPLETLTVPLLAPDTNIPPARAAAINELVRAGLDLTSYLTAAAATYDRYAGAVAANDTGWASQHANAFSYYLRQAALRMDDVADKLDALVAELHAEDLQFLLAAQDFQAYQQRLATDGFTDEEIEAARLVGKTDEGIALSLQRRLALQPDDVVGWFDARMLAAAQAFRELSLALTFVPMFGSTGGIGLAADTVDAPLVRIGDPVYSFQVGNPFTIPTTITLKVRSINLPPDWIIALSTNAVTLAPNEQVTVTVSATPGLPGVQGTQPRFAVEGFANGALLGGVEFQVYLPEEVPFLGAERVFLPIVQRP